MTHLRMLIQNRYVRIRPGNHRFRGYVAVVVGYTIFGALLFAAIVVISVLDPDCPFQTPLSLLIRFIINKVEVRWKKHRIPVATNLTNLVGGGLTVGAAPLHALHRQVFHSSLSLSWEKGYKLDARCIIRMLGMSTDMNTIRLTMDFVQGVVWNSGIKNIMIPLGWIYRKITSCFDFTHPQTPILIPALRDVAYLSAKAFAHIQFQQHCHPTRRVWYCGRGLASGYSTHTTRLSRI